MGYLEKIKYILRGSRYYRKYFQTTVNQTSRISRSF